MNFEILKFIRRTHIQQQQKLTKATKRFQSQSKQEQNGNSF